MILESASLLSFGKWLASKVADKGFDNIYKKIGVEKENALTAKFYAIVNRVSMDLQSKYPDILGGSIEYFFKKEEVFNELLKLLFRNSKIDLLRISENFDTRSLPDKFIEEFITKLREELLKEEEFDKILSDNELFVSLLGIGKDISVIATNSNISVLEVERITKILEERIGRSFIFKTFFELYSKNAINNLSQINFIGLGLDISIKKNRKNLSDIFILPKFKLVNAYSTVASIDSTFDSHAENIIFYKDLLEKADKIVILGDPGSGKSILIKSLICDILLKDNRIHANAFEQIPFRIELRKYLAFKKAYKGNILNYLSSLLEIEYQIPHITESIVHDLLTQRKCIIFFDGLDEIFDISDKIETKNDIENFDNGYPGIKIIVTSRVIGYEEAKFNEGKFSELSIQNFDNSQVVDYVTKWYAKEEVNTEVREKEVNGFLTKKSEIDSELISNPLLLSLIVIIYRNILKLPESKLEIYQSCTKTLVDKWDASKDLIINLEASIIKNKDKLFADLAYWQYEHLSGKSIIITYEKAKSTISKSIQEKLKLGDEFAAEDLAENFMNYAQKRSIYFENNFTHKTFLEYYTAYWIYSNVEKKHNITERNRLISKYISNAFWFIVLELLLNLIDKDQGDNEVIDEIVTNQINDSPNSLPFILTVLPSLKNIDAVVVKLSIQMSIDFLLENYQSRSTVDNSERLENKIFTALRKLFMNNILRSIIVDRVREIEDSKSTLKDATPLYILSMELTSFAFDAEYSIIGNSELYNKAVLYNSYLFILELYRYGSNKNDYMTNSRLFFENFGIRAMFVTHRAVYDNYYLGGFFSYYINHQTQPENIQDLRKNIAILKNYGALEDQILNYAYYEHGAYYRQSKLIKLLLVELETMEDIFLCKFLLAIFVRAFGPTKIGKKFWAKYSNSPKLKLARALQNTSPNEEQFNLIKALKLS
jgi:GTPase SAR1 family protein